LAIRTPGAATVTGTALILLSSRFTVLLVDKLPLFSKRRHIFAFIPFRRERSYTLVFGRKSD
jgi:hypothetical protein